MYDENFALKSAKVWAAYWLSRIYDYYRDSKIFDSREDVWFNFDSESVVLERPPKNGFFLGILGEFSTDAEKNVAVIDEKIATFDRPEIFDGLTTPARWNWAGETFRFCEEHAASGKASYAYTDGENIDFSFEFYNGSLPYWLRSSSVAVERTLNIESNKELFVWQTLEVAWEVSRRVQRLTPLIMAMFKEYKAPIRGRVLVYTNRSLTDIKERERLIIPGYSICLGSLQGLHYNALNWAKLQGRKRLTEVDLTNEIVCRLSYGAYSKYETDVIINV